MAPKNIKKKLPQNAFRYYAQMYYRRKHTIESRNSHAMDEIYKSWHSLSESERKQFQSQYNEYKMKYNQLLADRLKEAEPFMKRKKEHIKTNLNLSCSNSVVTYADPDMLDETVTSQTDEARRTSPEIDQSGTEFNETFDTENRTGTDAQVMELSNIGLGATPVEKDLQTEKLSEPTVPTVKTGKELYCMLNEDECTLWASLPQKDKKQYSRAVYLLKKEFITKFKKYLESLTSRELFDYYNKKNIV